MTNFKIEYKNWPDFVDKFRPYHCYMSKQYFVLCSELFRNLLFLLC